MREPRTFYEARVLLVPTGPTGGSIIDDMGAGGLRGVGRLDETSAAPDTITTSGRHRLTSLGTGWAADRKVLSLDEMMEEADVVLFVGTDLRDTGLRHLAEVAEAARDAGTLLAGVTVGPRGDDDRSRRALAELREHVDMLVNVSTVFFASAFIDVVRGGQREPVAQVAS